MTAKNYDTRTLLVTFRTQDDRERSWARLATRLKFKPENLGLRVSMGFLEAFADEPSDMASEH